MATDIILRSVKAAALTHAEMDQNWESLAQTVDAVVADVTIAVTDQNKILECSIASGTITLPTVANASGTDTDSFRVIIKNVNATALTVAGNGAETIEGSASVTLLENESSTFALESGALEWNIVNFYGPNLVGITASPTEINILNGATLSTTELNYVTGVTSAIQTQLTGKLSVSNNLSDVNSAATSRTNLGVDAAGTDNSTNVSLAGTPNYITIAGQVITRALINLATHVTGLLAEASLADDVEFTKAFTSSGTFTAPKTGSYVVTLISSAGGGGGGAGGNYYNYSGNKGGSGGGGGTINNSKYVVMSLTSGTNYTVTPGAGGAGGAGGSGGGNDGAAGTQGGTTTFNGNSITGGAGGTGGVEAFTAAGTAGGVGESNDVFNTGGGGAGGSGGASTTTGSAGSIVCGGGGGGGGNQSGAVAGAAGGAGGSGEIIIRW